MLTRLACVALCGLTLLPGPAALAACRGDCDGDGAVTVPEVVRLVGVALRAAGVASCPAGDPNGDGQVTIDELVVAVGNALNGCRPSVGGPWVQGDPLVTASTCAPSVEALVQRAIDQGGYDCVYDVDAEARTLHQACTDATATRSALLDDAGAMTSTGTSELTADSCRITITEALSADLSRSPTVARRVLTYRFTPACRLAECAIHLDATWALPPRLVGMPVYVSDVDGDAVWLIDSGTHEVVGPPIAVGDAPTAVAVTPDGRRAYVANHDADSLSVIVLGVRALRNPIKTGPGPAGLAITPDGERVYAAAQGNLIDRGLVSIFSTATNTLIVSRKSAGASDIAIGPDGARVYVVNFRAPGVLRVLKKDENDRFLEPDIPLDGTPTAVAVTPDGSYAYVTAFDFVSGGWVAVVDTAAGTVVGERIPVGFFPQDVAVTPDGTRVLVSNREEDTVSIIATESNTVVATVAVGNGPQGLAITPDGREAYVANGYGQSVSVIDLDTAAVVSTIPLGAFPADVAIGRAFE